MIQPGLQDAFHGDLPNGIARAVATLMPDFKLDWRIEALEAECKKLLTQVRMSEADVADKRLRDWTCRMVESWKSSKCALRQRLRGEDRAPKAFIHKGGGLSADPNDVLEEIRKQCEA